MTARAGGVLEVARAATAEEEPVTRTEQATAREHRDAESSAPSRPRPTMPTATAATSATIPTRTATAHPHHLPRPGCRRGGAAGDELRDEEAGDAALAIPIAATSAATRRPSRARVARRRGRSRAPPAGWLWRRSSPGCGRGGRERDRGRPGDGGADEHPGLSGSTRLSRKNGRTKARAARERPPRRATTMASPISSGAGRSVSAVAKGSLLGSIRRAELDPALHPWKTKDDPANTRSGADDQQVEEPGTANRRFPEHHRRQGEPSPGDDERRRRPLVPALTTASRGTSADALHAASARASAGRAR